MKFPSRPLNSSNGVSLSFSLMQLTGADRKYCIAFSLSDWVHYCCVWSFFQSQCSAYSLMIVAVGLCALYEHWHLRAHNLITGGTCMHCTPLQKGPIYCCQKHFLCHRLFHLTSLRLILPSPAVTQMFGLNPMVLMQWYHLPHQF